MNNYKKYELMIAVLLLIIMVMLGSCSKRIHVITEQDGDRVIKWYSEL
mgnify:FL=1